MRLLKKTDGEEQWISSRASHDEGSIPSRTKETSWMLPKEQWRDSDGRWLPRSGERPSPRTPETPSGTITRIGNCGRRNLNSVTDDYAGRSTRYLADLALNRCGSWSSPRESAFRWPMNYPEVASLPSKTRIQEIYKKTKRSQMFEIQRLNAFSSMSFAASRFFFVHDSIQSIFSLELNVIVVLRVDLCQC